MADCVNNKRNINSCNCSYVSCSRKGICCECLSYHRSRQEVPACFFPDDIEKTFDRSVGNFLKTSKR